MGDEDDDGGIEIKKIPAPKPKAPAQPPKTPATVTTRTTMDKKTGVITVNPASQLTADQMVERVRKHPNIPEVMKKAIEVHTKEGEKTIRIREISAAEATAAAKVAAKKAPKGTTVRVDIPAWWTFLVSASQSNEWEMTTGEILEIAKGPPKGSKDAPPPLTTMTPDLKSSDVQALTYMPQLGGGYGWEPQASTGFGIDKADLGITMVQAQWIQQPQAHDEAVRDGASRRKLARSRGLIVVANRVQCKKLSADAVCLVPGILTDDVIVNTFFHEAAVHAGAFSSGEPFKHPEKVVNDRAKEVEDSLSGKN